MDMYYTSDNLNRQTHLRRFGLNKTDYEIIPIWKGKNLLEDDGHGFRVGVLDKASIDIENDSIIFLGELNSRSYMAVDISYIDESEIKTMVNGEFYHVRHVISSLHQDEASLLAYATGMFNWHRSHKYCGKCGNKTIAGDHGHTLNCTNKSCGNTIFPRIDPAVIMLVEYTDPSGIKSCLLSRHASVHAHMWSTLAGFVEPGESLEQAMRREVMEEVGVVTNKVSYKASQPWPFPASIMIGFNAEASSTELTIDEEEIAEAAWFTAEEIITLVNKNEMILSKEDSIARYLIKKWVEEQTGYVIST